jgi:hypothetical protein
MKQEADEGRTRRLVGIVCTLVVWTVLQPAAWSAEFTADQWTRIGDRVYRANLFYRDDMWRIEHNNPGSADITIVRKDKGLMWLLMARMKQFKTLPLDRDAGLLFQSTLGREIAREVIGTETLDGHPTTVSQITVREGVQDIVYYQWWAEDLQLPLRVARKDGAWMVDYKNIKLRQISSQMFELPLHYRPIEP